MSLWARLEAALQAGRRGALITLARVEGSSPRDVGTKMLVLQGGEFSGSIGGGALEWQALARAQQLMRDAPEGRGETRTISLGPDLGQCCGGRVDLLIEAFGTSDGSWIAPLGAVDAGIAFATLGRRDGRGIFRRQITSQASQEALVLQDETTLLEHHGEARTLLLLFGAGHLGRALALALAPLPFAVRWVDTRAEIFPGVQPTNVTPVLTEDPIAEIVMAPPKTLFLAMTHSHALDFDLAAAGLSNPNITFVGVIGSATKRARFYSRLCTLGFERAMIEKMVCPIGIAELRDKAPAVIAAGIAVQLLEAREAMQQSAVLANVPIRKKAGHITV